MHSAVFSSDGKYRYYLYRRLSAQGEGVATFIMLNPSTADARQDDPTIRKCLGFCRHWGVAELQVVNLFAIRATRPAEMKKSSQPVGRHNRRWIERAVVQSPSAGRSRRLVIFGWGVHGNHCDQDRTVRDWLDSLAVEGHCLGITRDGHPRHPLYVPYSASLIPFAWKKLKQSQE